MPASQGFVWPVEGLVGGCPGALPAHRDLGDVQQAVSVGANVHERAKLHDGHLQAQAQRGMGGQIAAHASADAAGPPQQQWHMQPSSGGTVCQAATRCCPANRVADEALSSSRLQRLDPRQLTTVPLYHSPSLTSSVAMVRAGPSTRLPPRPPPRPPPRRRSPACSPAAAAGASAATAGSATSGSAAATATVRRCCRTALCSGFCCSLQHAQRRAEKRQGGVAPEPGLLPPPPVARRRLSSWAGPGLQAPAKPALLPILRPAHSALPCRPGPPPPPPPLPIPHRGRAQHSRPAGSADAAGLGGQLGLQGRMRGGATCGQGGPAQSCALPGQQARLLAYMIDMRGPRCPADRRAGASAASDLALHHGRRRAATHLHDGGLHLDVSEGERPWEKGGLFCR